MDFEAYMALLNPEVASQVGGFYGFDYGGGGGNPYANINPNRYNHLGRTKNPGDKLFADLIRAQTRDYQQRFAPVERELVDMITPTGTTALEGDLDRTRQAVMAAGMNVQGQQNRSMERLGIYGDSAIGNGNDTVGALVGGLNDTRMRDADRRNQVLYGVGSGVAQRARGQL